jgi:hypothetical protein
MKGIIKTYPFYIFIDNVNNKFGNVILINYLCLIIKKQYEQVFLNKG